MAPGGNRNGDPNSVRDAQDGDRRRKSSSRKRPPAGVWDGQLILTLDGGGIRGYSTLLILQALMQEIALVERRLQPRAPSSSHSPLFQSLEDFDDDEDVGPESGSVENAYRPCHYFDYICGTSTGGISAIMLGTMRLTVSETMERSRTIWRGVIPGYHTKFLKAFGQLPSRTRNSHKMQKYLKNVLGRVDGDDTFDFQHETSNPAPQDLIDAVVPTSMKTDEGKCQTIVFAMHNARRGVMRPYAIRSYEHTAWTDPLICNPERDTTTMSVVDACRATTATPTYFEKVKIEDYDGSFVDGSLWTTNPALDVYREVNDIYGKTNNTPIKGLLSVGYSTATRQGLQAETSGVDAKNPDQSDEILRELQGRKHFEYDRLVCPASHEQSSDLDKWFGRLSDEVARHCRTDGKMRKAIKKWAEFLVSIRRQRARTVRWETYAGLRRSCPLCSADDVLPNRYALRDHLQNFHKLSAQDLPHRMNFDTSARKFGQGFTI